MSTLSEQNQFRRLIGDFQENSVDVSTIEGYLDDAARDYSSRDWTLTLTIDFDLVPDTRKVEIIYYAAIQWWWNRAAHLSDKHSQTVGQSSQNVGEKWDRAMQMIQQLESMLNQLQTTTAEIAFGNNSRFSKATLTRLGGAEEEAVRDGYN